MDSQHPCAIGRAHALATYRLNGGVRLLSVLRGLLLALAERHDRFEIHLVGETHYTLESSFIVFSRLSVFFEGDNDFGLCGQERQSPHSFVHTLASLGPGS